MDFYIPKKKCCYLTFSDFTKTSCHLLPPCVQVISVFSFYKNYNFDLSILHHDKPHYVKNFNLSCLPTKDTDIALLVPYSCLTKNLPYLFNESCSEKESFDIYKDFWNTHVLTQCHTEDYLYDPKHALGFGEKNSFYGDFEVFNTLFENLLEHYKDIVVSSSFWNLHGFCDISKRFKNRLFRKNFPALTWAIENRTIDFNSGCIDQRLLKISGYFKKACHIKKETTPCHKAECAPCVKHHVVHSLASVHISGVIDWTKDLESLKEYLCEGGKFKWLACEEECEPSIVTMCPKSFMDVLEDQKTLKVLESC